MKDLFQKIFVLGGITYLLTSLFRKLLWKTCFELQFIWSGKVGPKIWF